MSFADESIPPWAIAPSDLTLPTLADLDTTARHAAWLLHPDQHDAMLIRCVEAVPTLVAEVRRLRARLEAEPERIGGAL